MMNNIEHNEADGCSFAYGVLLGGGRVEVEWCCWKIINFPNFSDSRHLGDSWGESAALLVNACNFLGILVNK